MPLIAFVRHRYTWFGLAAVILISGCILASALVYRGRSGEPYSILNHFISELGEVGVSELAGLFNAGLILAGLLFLPFAVGLGLALPGWIAKLGAVAGGIASIALAGVGIFPMNNLEPHTITATTYFRSAMVMVLLFGLAILLQPGDRTAIDKRANLVSLLTVASFAAFIAIMQTPSPDPSGSMDLSPLSNRSDFWSMALLEWSTFFAVVVWFFVIALAGWSQSDRRG